MAKAVKHSVMWVMILSMLLALAEATPPGIANNPSNSKCTNGKYKYCKNLEHVCPKFCPNGCTTDCVSCKPICTDGTVPPPNSGSSPAYPTPSAPNYTPPPTPTPTPVYSPPPIPTSPPLPPYSPAPPATPSLPSPPTPTPPSPTPYTPPPSTSTPPLPPSSPAPPKPTPSPPTPTPPSSTPYTPPPSTSTPPQPPSSPTPPKPTPSPNPPASPTPTPPSSTPYTPPPSTSTPPLPPSSPTPPKPTPSPSPIPPASPSPTPPSPTPYTPPPTPYTPPPTTPSSPSPPESDAAAKRARCKNKNYPQCYNMEHVCPSACPGGCEVDCVTCRPVCKCDMPGAVCQDPRFIGGDGITFYFHGKKEQDFCLVSDSDIHINGHFIGKRSQNMTRDFTWVQSIGILFGNHKLFVGAQKTATWDDAVDRLALAFDGEPIYLHDNGGAQWRSEAATGVSVTRISDTNSVVVEVEGKFKITAKVDPITEEDSRVHKYGITKDDCFAHLDLGFKFLSLSDQVSGVLGQTYRDDYVSKVKMGVSMPVMGGERKFVSSSLFATDCAVSRFQGRHYSG